MNLEIDVCFQLAEQVDHVLCGHIEENALGWGLKSLKTAGLRYLRQNRPGVVSSSHRFETVHKQHKPYRPALENR